MDRSNCPLKITASVTPKRANGDNTHFYDRPLYNQVLYAVSEALLAVLAGQVLC